MRSGLGSRRGFWCSTTGDGTPLDARPGAAAARCRARLGTPQYHPVAAFGRRGGRRRRLPVFRLVARRLAGEPRLLRPRRYSANLAAARPLRAPPAGSALGNFEPGPLLDDADPNPAWRTPGAQRSVPLVSAPELPAGDRRNRRVAARVRGRSDSGVIFGPERDVDLPAHPDRGERSGAAAKAVRSSA